MKKTISLLLILISLVCFVSGCGNNKKLNKSDDNSFQENQNVKIEDSNKEEISDEAGYTSAPDFNSYVELEDGTKIVSNELLIVFNDNVSQDNIKNLIKKYDGEIVGQLYIINQYQIRFPNSGKEYIENLKNKFELEEIVDNVIYNSIEETSIN